MAQTVDAEVVVEGSSAPKTNKEQTKAMACNAFVSTVNSPYFWILVGVVGTVVFQKLCEKFDE